MFRAEGTSEQGLSSEEARNRLAIYGPNELPREKFSWIKILINQFTNPMFVILIVVAVISGFLGQPEQSAIILVIIGLSVVLGFYNEFRAEKLVEELKDTVSIKAVVTRDAKTSELDSALLVPGDLVTVYIGDIVPADMRIIDSKELQVNEAVLTGESFPVDKNPERLSNAPSALTQASNLLFMGTVVTKGIARGIVTSTGKNTEFGSISKSLARAHPETEFQKGTKRYGNLLLTLTFFLAIGIFGFNALVGHSLLNSLLFSLAVAIGIVPEMMPGIVTITLSRGAHKMAKEKVIVKRLVSMENLGNINVLCTDKTGTLTEGKIILENSIAPDGTAYERPVTLSVVCSAATFVGEKISGNPMDVAIQEYAIQEGLQNLAADYQKVNEVPFDYHRRMVTVIANCKDELILITKGAPESVLQKCKYVEWNKEKTEITPELTEEMSKNFNNFSEKGLRVLAVACGETGAKREYSSADETDLTMVGFLVFTDPPKLNAGSAIAKLKALGVDTKILTGDNELIAKKVCEDLGLHINGIVTGSDLTPLSWVEFKSRAEEATIFARVTPDQKLD